MAVNRAEERLFAQAVEEFPAATPSLDMLGFDEELRGGLAELLRRDRGEPFCAATDGSACLDIAASSVSCYVRATACASILLPVLGTKTNLPSERRCLPCSGWRGLALHNRLASTLAPSFPDPREDLESRYPNLGPYTTKGTL